MICKKITKLHIYWSDTNSEIVKRMNSSDEKLPEILKPIITSKERRNEKT